MLVVVEFAQSSTCQPPRIVLFSVIKINYITLVSNTHGPDVTINYFKQPNLDSALPGPIGNDILWYDTTATRSIIIQ